MDTLNQQKDDSQLEGFSIDYKRILYQCLRYWYLILLSIATGLTIAFLVNRYSARVYAINASVIVKETEEVSGGELIYNNPLVKFYRNYLNELYIIKSLPLFERTIRDLNFEHRFLREGNILTTEYYKGLPLTASVIGNDSRSFTVRFQILNRNQFQLVDWPKEGETKAFEFGELVAYGNTSFKFELPDTVSNLGGSKDQIYIYSYIPADRLAQQYVPRLSASWAEEGSGVINLSITGVDAQKEKDFMQALIRNYQNLDLDNKNQTAQNTIRFINEQLANITDSLRKAERQLEAFKNKNVVTDLKSEASRLYQRMEALEIQKTELNIGDRYFDYLNDYLSKATELDQIVMPSSVGVTDPILTALIGKLVSIQTEMRLALRVEKLQGPIVEEKRRAISELKKDILESIQNQRSVQKIKMDFLNKGIKELEDQLNYLPLADRQLVGIQRNYSLLENLYVFLLQKRAEMGISKASNTTDIVVVNPPLAVGPISPSPSRNYMIGLLAGLFLPLGVFLFLEWINTRIQSKEDIEKMTSIPFIGGVGHKRGDLNLEVFTRPKSSISESFRALRSNLNYFLGGQEKGLFLVTSSVSGEGKTFTSINLAAVFALSGKKTLIVGADMRKPRLYGDFELSNDTGLSNYLANISDFNSVVQKTKHDNLYLVSGGPVPPNPSELLLTRRMNDFLEEAKKQFDIIFIDSPPLALVTDAFLLAPKVDHTLFIVRQDYTPKSLLRSIDDYYRAEKIKKISIVLNDISKSGPGYGYGYTSGYGYAYGYGYGYAYGYGVYGRKKKRQGEGYYEED